MGGPVGFAMNSIFGKKMGRYLILNQLGAGGMATVYNAFDSRDERNVAVKVILPSKRSSQIFIQQFEKEAKVLAGLNHTNIVKVLDYGLDNEQPFLVMDYIQGGTLKEAMKEPFRWEKAAAILAPIARALEYVHQQDIIHRDVKPSNILIDENYNPLLSDFGIVKLLESQEEVESTAIGVGVGTPDYMSPEQGIGKSIDYRADIYSLGLVFYEMVTGHKAYTADSPMAMVIKHVTDEIPKPSILNQNIPEYVEVAIMRAVQKDPQSRYQSMSEFADVLEMIAIGDKAPKKRILKLAGKKGKILKPVFLSSICIFFVLFLTYFVMSYYRFFDNNNLPVLSLYELGTLVAPSNEEITLTPQSKMTKVVIDEKKKVQTVVGFTTPTIEVLVENTKTPQLPSVSMETNIEIINYPSYLSTPLSYPNTAEGFSKIASWGIGGGNKVEWSHDGSKIGIATTDGVYIYNTANKKVLSYINIDGIATTFTFSHDDSVIAVATKTGKVSLWNTVSGEMLTEIKIKLPVVIRELPSTTIVTAVQFSSDDQTLLIGYENGVINLYDLISNNHSFAVEQYPSVKDLKFSKDQRYFYATNHDGSIFKWSVSNAKKENEFKNPGIVDKINISPNGELLLAAGTQGVVYLWNLQEDRMVYSFANLGAPVKDMTFSNDNQYIVIGLKNGKIKTFKKPTPEEYFGIVSEIYTIEGNGDDLQSVSFSPISNQFVTSSWDNSLIVWDFDSGEEIYRLEYSMEKIKSMYFSPSGDWLVSEHHENKIRVWNVDQASLLYEFFGYLPKGYPFSEDGKYLVIGTPGTSALIDDQLTIINRTDGLLITSLKEMNKKYYVRFTDDSNILAYGSVRTANLWDVSTWEKLKIYGRVTKYCGEFFTPQSELLALVSDAGILFENNNKIFEMCGTHPEGAFYKYYFPEVHEMVFVLGDGNIREWEFKDFSLNDLRVARTIIDSDEFFIAGDSESGYYAASSGGSLVIKHINKNEKKVIPYQDDYKYKAAFNSEKGIFALGSQFGVIEIWTLP